MARVSLSVPPMAPGAPGLRISRTQAAGCPVMEKEEGCAGRACPVDGTHTKKGIS